jgi:hypothetical protein
MRRRRCRGVSGGIIAMWIVIVAVFFAAALFVLGKPMLRLLQCSIY